jgi:hypothetical protein
MTTADELAAARPRLFALAYRMLGSATDADVGNAVSDPALHAE